MIDLKFCVPKISAPGTSAPSFPPQKPPLDRGREEEGHGKGEAIRVLCKKKIKRK